MADLKEVAELAWRQLFPNPTDETPITREEFVATAKTEYAYQMWLQAMEERRENDEEYNVASFLLTESEELPVVNKRISIKDLKIMRSLPFDMWVQNVGGFNCECDYVKSNMNLTQLMCDDDSLDDNTKTYFPVGNELWFPQGTHKDKLRIIYANNGEKVDETIDVEDAMAGRVRVRLIEIYGGKIGAEDTSNNSNPNN